MLVGEAPGAKEEQTGRCFVGKSGQELDRILERCDLDRAVIYTTNVCKERPPYVNGKQLAPSKEDIERDEQELIDELLRAKPKWVGAVGRVATQWFLGGDKDLESTWGMAYEFREETKEQFRARVQEEARHSILDLANSGEDRGGGKGNVSTPWWESTKVVPLYHPAAGLHNSDLSAFVWRGIEIFGDYTHGRLPPILPVDLFPHPSYTRDPDVARGMYGSDVACDTEGLPGRVWGGSVSSTPGTAWVGSVLEAQQLREVLNYAPTIVFQNALHDVPILEEIGIPVDWAKVEDTFLMAYCLRLVPLGLKQLARRFCGMEMQSYLDVVAPADRRLALEYVERALNTNKCVVCDGTGKVPERRKDDKGWKKQLAKCPACIDGGLWPDRSAQLKYDWDTGNWKLTKGWSVGRYLRNLRKDMNAGKYEEQDDETGEMLSVRKRITGWPSDVLGAIESEIGTLPEPTLDDIPPADATFYSARDADATIRVYPILSQQIDQLKLRDAYKLDLSVIPVAAEMQKNGMYIDRQYFAEFVKELEDDNQILLARLETACGRPLNPASGDQVAGLLFGERGLVYNRNDEFEYGGGLLSFDLEPDTYTKSGKRGSTNDKTLEGLKLKHSSNAELVRIIDLILDYRVRDKILGTYARKMPMWADENGRVHTTIKPCRTATFRWASANPNCFTGDTEVLTLDGWSRLDELEEGTSVAQWREGVVEFVLPSGNTVQSNQRVLSLQNQHIDLAITPNHRCLLRHRKTNELRVFSGADYPEDWQQLHSGKFDGEGGAFSSSELQLMLAFQADGSWARAAMDFSFSKQRKIERLRRILDDCGVVYKVTVGVHRTRFYVPSCALLGRVRACLDAEKRLTWGWALSLSADEIALVTNEVMLWDGCATRMNHYASKHKQNADIIATLFSLSDRRAVVRRYVSQRGSVSWQVDVTTRGYSMTTNISRGELPSQTVYCVSVPSEFLLVRRNGKVMVTGNCQNIPTRKKGNVDLGKRVRQGFVAPGGYVLGSWDFDQIEMRVLAWYSQDEALLKIFREGLDIHSMTAALVWRIPFDQFMAELEGDDKVLAAERKGQRLSAKNIGFGVVYGVTAKGLKAQMELRGQYWTEEECQELINKYLYEAYPGIGRFMMEAHAEARRNGYVRSLFGHIRYVPGVHSSIASVREEALRQAANFKIQATAAELLKVAMRALWHEYKPVLDQLGSKLLMAVHDELLLQVPDNPYARQITDAVVTAAMTDPVFLEGVTVGTTGKFDYNWALLK